VANETARRLRERLRQIREHLELSQEAFADKSGLKYKHYQAIEAGRKENVRLDTLVKLAKASGLELWELLNVEVPLAVAEDAGKERFRAPARRVGKIARGSR
jgi:transcriptional regulator with XRE-family HTH domain